MLGSLGGRTRDKRPLRATTRVRVVEFRRTDIQERSQRAAAAFARLLEFSSPKTWDQYRELIALENRIARKAGLPLGSVFIDIPRIPRLRRSREPAVA